MQAETIPYWKAILGALEISLSWQRELLKEPINVECLLRSVAM